MLHSLLTLLYSFLPIEHGLRTPDATESRTPDATESRTSDATELRGSHSPHPSQSKVEAYKVTLQPEPSHATLDLIGYVALSLLLLRLYDALFVCTHSNEPHLSDAYVESSV